MSERALFATVLHTDVASSVWDLPGKNRMEKGLRIKLTAQFSVRAQHSTVLSRIGIGDRKKSEFLVSN
jgi:hypothetical protein